MTGTAAPRVRGGPTPFAPSSDTLTRVELTTVARRIDNSIRFGQETGEQILDPHHRIVTFRPGSVFAFVRRATSDFGTIIAHIDIVRAVAIGEPFQTLPFVRPGGDILLHLRGGPAVETVLKAIDAIEVSGIDPTDVTPDHWRHIHNRISAGEPFRTYRRDQHRAWLRRREFQP